MSDPIDRQAAIDAIEKHMFPHYECSADESENKAHYNAGLLTAVMEVGNLPAEESEHKTGKWILACRDSVTQWNRGDGTCSECKTYQFGICDEDHWQNYCGHCGAKMEGVEE